MTRAVLLAAAVTVAGCVRLAVPAPQFRDYRLTYDPPAIAGAPLPVVLRVPPLTVDAIYDREPILYRDDAYSTGAYADSHWSANPGVMIADLLARDFAASGLYRAVQTGASVVPPDYQLSGHIEEIEERPQTPACAAHLRLRIALLRLTGATEQAVVWQQTYGGDEPCPCNDPRALAAAMSTVMARVSEQVQTDVHRAIAARRPS